MDQQPADTQQEQFSILFETECDYTRPRRGQIRQAVVLSVDENDVIVDLGCKRDGIVPRKDLEMLDEVYRAGLQVGDHVPVCVLTPSSRQGELVVSLKQGLVREDWLRAQKYMEDGTVCEAEVMEVNRGGVIVGFGRLRGFVPNSLLTSVLRGMRGERLHQAKSALVGQTLSLVVTEVNERRHRLVLSQRAADWRKRLQLLEELTKGEIRTGVVRKLVNFGAFVDLGGIDGLIHISELDWKYVTHPGEVLSVGDEVEVYVLNVDRERERVGLSRKRVLPDPWISVAEELEMGQVVDGVVSGKADFGIFVDLGAGVDGLVHVSEMPDKEAVYAELDPGDPIRIRVLEIDRWRRRIALSLQGVERTVPSSVVEDGVPLLADKGEFSGR
jgi:small subunit ribosomal protein S1